MIGEAFDLAILRMRHGPPRALAPSLGRCSDGRAGPCDGQAFRLELLGEQEREFERLAGVQPGIDQRLVALVEIVDRDLGRAADASVTSWPVISGCTPPGWVPSARCTAKNSFTSRRIASKGRVLRPFEAVTVLPCMGSHAFGV